MRFHCKRHILNELDEKIKTTKTKQITNRKREIELAHLPERVLLQNFKTTTTNMVDSATYTTNVPVDDVNVDSMGREGWDYKGG